MENIFGIFKSKVGPSEMHDLQRLEGFIAEYDASPQKNIYAMHLWGVDAALNKVFGSLEGYHSSDAAKRTKYLTLMGMNAINSVKQGDLVSAACSNFFMNYLVATKECGRGQLTGSLKQIAERVDGIVRHGALEMGLSGGGPQLPADEVGQQLFRQGMKAASEYRTADAIALYTQSFETSPNPSPLINRAKLYRWRMLFDEAIRDLEAAMRLDKQQGDEFSIPLVTELRECKFLAQNRLNGNGEIFIADLRSEGFDRIAGRLADSIFEGNGQLLGYHLVNEVDNVSKFENLSDFPSVKMLLGNWMKDQRVIDQVLSDPIISREYKDKRAIFESIVCIYDYEDMAKIRDTIVRKIWCILNPPSKTQTLWEASLRMS